jgi:hypothetical protein
VSHQVRKSVRRRPLKTKGRSRRNGAGPSDENARMARSSSSLGFRQGPQVRQARRSKAVRNIYNGLSTDGRTNAGSPRRKEVAICGKVRPMRNAVACSQSCKPRRDPASEMAPAWKGRATQNGRRYLAAACCNVEGAYEVDRSVLPHSPRHITLTRSTHWRVPAALYTVG